MNCPIGRWMARPIELEMGQLIGFRFYSCNEMGKFGYLIQIKI